MRYSDSVATATKTLKLPFLRLNANKAKEFAQLQSLNTQLANRILAMPKAKRKELTTAAFRDVEIGIGLDQSNHPKRDRQNQGQAVPNAAIGSE